MNKRRSKNKVMILVEMCLEWVKGKGHQGGDGKESRTRMKERALGGISGERRAKDARVGREAQVLKMSLTHISLQ